MNTKESKRSKSCTAYFEKYNKLPVSGCSRCICGVACELPQYQGIDAVIAQLNSRVEAAREFCWNNIKEPEFIADEESGRRFQGAEALLEQAKELSDRCDGYGCKSFETPENVYYAPCEIAICPAAIYAVLEVVEG